MLIYFVLQIFYSKTQKEKASIKCAFKIISPSLLNFAVISPACVVGNISQRAVDGGKVRIAHIQEVWPHAPNRNLGDVRKRLADGASEDEHAHLSIQDGDIWVSHK